MDNCLINGRRVKDGLKCPVCDTPMSYKSCTRNFGEVEYTQLWGFMEAYCSGPGTTDISLFCEKCGASVDIIGSRGKLRKANPGRPLTWEYVIMAIGIVKYGRVKNLGDYGTEWFEAEYVLESGENVDGAVAECKAFVKRQLGTGPSEDDLEQARELLRENGEL